MANDENGAPFGIPKWGWMDRALYQRWNGKKWETAVVHHIDGNPANNAPENLRLVWPSDHGSRES